MEGLFILDKVIRVMCPTEFFSDVEIKGFINIENRQWVRAVRREACRNLEDLWRDTKEAREAEECNGVDFDIFDLTKLFGMEPYEIVEVEEPWDP
ncbi:uncharacterized protein LOC126858654 [Cataglyphis hispanica]|uniref:uncharacterized protein LOC126858654 n=1 Tax=Cataglyphis hispanica TaxID=1086592 RepID=UPI00217F2C45|nr:uncharacterized protein LOC126858654 [Cataglyphis hispanica]